ncbi:MAG: hypothetical protein ABL957_02625 [Parvularculaceae bacterium]
MFAKRSQGDETSLDRAIKRSPLGALLNRREIEEDELPQADIAAGLSRVLRAPAQQPAPAAQNTTDLESVRAALSSIEASLYAIDSIRDIIEQAYEVALSAQDVEDAGGRALLAESYDELRLSINKTIDALDERAATLIGKSQRHLDVKLGGKAHYSVSPTRLDVTQKGLNLAPPRDAFATFDEINNVLAELDTALKKADRTAAGYCRDAQFLIARMNQASAE